jgi:hypothetical protein
MFYGTVDFDPSGNTHNLTSGGSRDVFVAKYSSTGSFIWAFNVSGSGDAVFKDLELDASGNVYITGWFSGTADYDPDSGTTNDLTSNGSNDIFIAKYDTNGNHLWAFNIGGSSFDRGYGIAVDGSGNVYGTGMFTNTVDFDPGAGTNDLTNNGIRDIYVAKYDSNGNHLWAFSVGGGDFDFGFDCEVDASSNVYVTGTFTQSNVDFDPGANTNTLSSNGAKDVFVAKYDSGGNYQWAFGFGGSGNGSANDDEPYRITVDGSSNVIVTGYFVGTNVDFDPSASNNFLSSTGGHDIFIAKYDSNGNHQWAFNAGGTGDDRGRGISTDASGNVYLAGFFEGMNIDFDPGANTNDLSSNGAKDVFIAKYDSGGNYQWAYNAGDTDDDLGYQVNATGDDEIHVVGTFSGTNVDFDPTAGTFNLSSPAVGDRDLFVLKYGAPATENALDFDGTDDYVDCGDIDALDGAVHLTFEHWLYMDTYAGADQICIKRPAGNVWFQYNFTDATQVEFRFNDNVSGVKNIFFNYSFPTTTWFHMALVLDMDNATNDDKFKLYVNGVEITNKSVATGLPSSLGAANSASFLIGRNTAGTFEGLVDEFRIWSTDLNATDVGNLYNKTVVDPTLLSSCIIAYYKMNETSGTSLPDESGNGNNGTVAGGAGWTASTAPVTSQSYANCAAALPVDLTYFRAQATTNGTLLTWQTASEINNEGFEIQRSTDGNNWQNIGFVNGRGTAYETSNYQFMDTNPQKGVNYYRLKQMDYDGAFDYSNVVSVEVAVSGKLLAISPNPVQNGELTLYIPDEDMEEATLEIFNTVGQLVRTEVLTSNQATIRVNDLSKGMYLFSLNTNGQRSVEKVIIK